MEAGCSSATSAPWLRGQNRRGRGEDRGFREGKRGEEELDWGSKGEGRLSERLRLEKEEGRQGAAMAMASKELWQHRVQWRKKARKLVAYSVCGEGDIMLKRGDAADLPRDLLS